MLKTLKAQKMSDAHELLDTTLIGSMGATAVTVATAPDVIVPFYDSVWWHGSVAILGFGVGVLTIVSLIITIKGNIRRNRRLEDGDK